MNRWFVRNEKMVETVKSQMRGGNFIDYNFFNYYLKDLLNMGDGALIPDEVIFYLDHENYSMMYILDGLHQFMNVYPRLFNKTSFVFEGSNKQLVSTYQKVVKKMKKAVE
ncbi:hypothetical protein PBI_SCTP2_497 [Salicola phage SCTP-2]|nr:hypothetical protein PBI_SCTP2_497 [Salicola phage SCTP-2]